MALLLPDYWADFIRSRPIEDVKPLGVAPGGGNPSPAKRYGEGAHRVRTEDRYRDRGVDEPPSRGKGRHKVLLLGRSTKQYCWE